MTAEEWFVEDKSVSFQPGSRGWLGVCDAAHRGVRGLQRAYRPWERPEPFEPAPVRGRAAVRPGGRPGGAKTAWFLSVRGELSQMALMVVFLDLRLSSYLLTYTNYLYHILD